MFSRNILYKKLSIILLHNRLTIFTFTMVELKCNSSKNIYELSKLCSEFPVAERIDKECYVGLEDPIMLGRNFFGSMLCLVVLASIVGNAVTLMIIPLAGYKKSHSLDRNFRRTTIFILDLCAIDLFVLLFMCLPSIYTMFKPQWVFGKGMCKLYALIWQNCYAIESLAIAVISAGRWIDSISPRTWRTLTHNNLYLTLLLSIPWVATIPSIIPALLDSSDIDTGWNCSIGCCTQMTKCTIKNGCPTHSWQWNFILIYNCVITFSSICVTVFSYFMIKRKVRRSSVRIITLNQNNELQLQKRERKMTKTVLFLVSCHLICNIPCLIIDTVYGFAAGGFLKRNALQNGLYGIAYMMFYSQYVINIFIYAISNNQFQKAYMDIWNCSYFRK